MPPDVGFVPTDVGCTPVLLPRSSRLESLWSEQKELNTHPESRKQAASSIRPRRACAPVYHGFKDVVKPTSGGAPTHLQPSGKQASNPRLAALRHI